MAALDQLIDELRSDGSVDSEGRFTLDREQARAKMQKFQLVDARRYVLELVQAAVLRDATAIAFDIDADDMRMRFDGLPFTNAELDDLYGSLFGEGDTRAIRGVRQLALALNAAMGMEPKYINLRSGNVELRMAPGKPDEIVTHERAVAGTEIHVRQRLRVAVVANFFLNLVGRIAEEQYLRDRCLYSTVPITLDGKLISAGLFVDEPRLATLQIEGQDFRGSMSVVERAAFCELRLVKDGVWIDSKELRAAGTYLVAVIEGDNLRKDVSQAKIVETAALERIEAALLRSRWRLWQLVHDKAAARAAGVIGEQLLEHATCDELREVPEARALAGTLSWSDCRAPERRVTLAGLCDLAAADKTPRFATSAFPELPCEGDPILLLQLREDAEALSRVLGRELVEADDLLARERRRVLGRKAWLERRGPPELPRHVGYAARRLVRIELESGLVHGEVAIDDQVSTDAGNKSPAHLFMYKDGCLLGRTELDIGLPGVWMALEAGFTPNDDYTDAVRNTAFIDILLQSLAALHEPLTSLYFNAADRFGEPVLRGLVKRWLIPLVDQKRRVALLTGAGVDVAGRFQVEVGRLLPSLAKQRLLGDEAGADRLAALPMFQPLVGPPLSLAQLGALIRANETLAYVDKVPEDPRLKEPDVVLLGPGDRKIVRGLFGEQRLRKWDPSAKQRELEFWDSERSTLAGERIAAAAELREQGASAEAWLVDLPDGPTRGFLFFDTGGDLDDFEELQRIHLEVRYEGRELCGVPLPGPAPICAVIEHPDLRPAAGWDDVVRDGAYEAAIAAVRAAIPELIARAAATLDDQRGPTRRWIMRVLLHAAIDPDLRALVEHASLLPTVDGKLLSLHRAAELVRVHGKLEYVGRDLGSAPVGDPPVVVADDEELDDLQAIFGDKLEDASTRVRHHRVFDLLGSRPPLTEAKLDPEQVFVTVPVRGQDQIGEIGLSRDRSDATLWLRLGLAGRQVGELEASDVAVPVDAIVIDDQLPLDPEGEIEVTSKRVKALLRQCRRRVPELILALCERLPSLRGDERARAWRMLVAHLHAEANQERRKIREQAFDAAAAVPGFRDVRGGAISLAEILTKSRGRPLDVLTRERFANTRVELPAIDRLILIVDADELECIEAHAEVRELDEVWEQELEAIRALASAPKVETPNIHDTALAYRKAMVAGGLECELWLPREPSVFEAGPPELIFARDGRELARGCVSEILACAGIVRGDGLDVLGGEVDLEPRQITSLERQQVILYADLARMFADGKVAKSDHERALEYLARAKVLLDGSPESLRGHGKHVLSLGDALAEIVPPSLRDAIRRRLRPEPAPKPEPKPEPKPAPPPQAEPARPVAEPEVAVAPEPTVVAPRPIPQTPEQRLLYAIYEQLHWARARHHDLLDELLLNNLKIARWGRGELATIDGKALELNADHPVVTRLLRQDPHDPIDLAFLTAALYSLLNYEAEEISDDDEREFVGQLAESLALAGRVRE